MLWYLLICNLHGTDLIALESRWKVEANHYLRAKKWGLVILISTTLSMSATHCPLIVSPKDHSSSSTLIQSSKNIDRYLFLQKSPSSENFYLDSIHFGVELQRQLNIPGLIFILKKAKSLNKPSPHLYQWVCIIVYEQLRMCRRRFNWCSKVDIG